MVKRRKIYDFSASSEGEEAPPAAPPVSRDSDFFIDGWDAYERWLDGMRDTMDTANDKPD